MINMKIKSYVYSKLWSFQAQWLYPTDLVSKFDLLQAEYQNDLEEGKLSRLKKAENEFNDCLKELLMVRNSFEAQKSQFKSFFERFEKKLDIQHFHQGKTFHNKQGEWIQFSETESSSSSKEFMITLYIPDETWGRMYFTPQVGRFLQLEIVIENWGCQAEELSAVWKHIGYTVTEKYIQMEATAQGILENYRQRYQDISNSSKGSLMQSVFSSRLGSEPKKF